MGYATEKRPRQLGVNPLTAEKIPPAFHCQAKNGSAVSVEEYAFKPRRIRYTFTNLVITMTDATTNGNHGGHKFADFNAGVLVCIGAISNLSLVAAAGIDADAALIGSVGSVVAATANEALTSTEADIIPSTVCTLTDSAGVMDGEFTTLAALNGTGTAVDLYLNFVAPGADATANSTITVNGYIDLIVLPLGDND